MFYFIINKKVSIIVPFLILSLVHILKAKSFEDSSIATFETSVTINSESQSTTSYMTTTVAEITTITTTGSTLHTTITTSTSDTATITPTSTTFHTTITTSTSDTATITPTSTTTLTLTLPTENSTFTITLTNVPKNITLDEFTLIMAISGGIVLLLISILSISLAIECSQRRKFNQKLKNSANEINQVKSSHFKNKTPMLKLKEINEHDMELEEDVVNM